MTTAIMFSFIIPAIVAAVLTGMLIKERDYFFHRKEVSPTESEDQKKQRSREDESSHLNGIDLSGGLWGI
jgi:hypothetical protein